MTWIYFFIIVFVYIGGVVGPAIGYVGGGFVLDIYTNFYSIKDEE